MNKPCRDHGQSMTALRRSSPSAFARLAALHHEGVLTPEELVLQKKQITGWSSRVEDAIRLLRGLKALEREGVLTEGEFNIKKWDILSKRLLRKD